MRPVWLHFEDGTSFKGLINREDFDPIWGEAAFTTAVTGYEETATDPSFLGQHIIFSTSHVGNYPSNPQRRQSSRVHATALIMRNFSPNDFFSHLNIPLVSTIDTRSLVRYLVNTGSSHKSVLSASASAPKDFFTPPLLCNKLERVSQKDIRVEIPGDRPIALINYGAKKAIVEKLKCLGFPLVSFPYNTTAESVLSYRPRLIFLSNGPGDPKVYTSEISVVKTFLSHNIPLRGICLGHQLLCMALDADVERMTFGQRGTNHPVFDYRTGKNSHYVAKSWICRHR